MEKRKLTIKEKSGVLSALMMFFAIGMMMGGSSAGNLVLSYIGAGVFFVGAIIAIWLILASKTKEDEEEFFEE